MANVSAARLNALPGYQGLPICGACGQRFRYRTDCEGRALESCHCGEHFLALIDLGFQPRALGHGGGGGVGHGQISSHPWKA